MTPPITEERFERMIWNGETQAQYEDRVSKGILMFALFPRQMVDGRWVWLDYYWAGLHKGPNNRSWWVRAINREGCLPTYPTRPPAPRRCVSSVIVQRERNRTIENDCLEKQAETKLQATLKGQNDE